jgi:hypothetical protein
MYVESYPNQVTSGQLGDPMPIDSQWDLAVEAFGTKYCYLKLQQTEMYAVWDDLYQKQKASLSRDESAKQSKNISQEGTVSMVNDPVNNPFITNWN